MIKFELKQHKNWFSNNQEEVINFPSFLISDNSGYSFLAKLIKITSKKRNFVLDFKNVTRFEPNLCAVVGAILIKSNESFKSNFSIINIQSEVLSKTLENNGFHTLLNGMLMNENITSSIPFSVFDMKNEEDVENYIYKYILKTRWIPKMSDGAKRKIYRSIFELYQNSVMHSGASKIFVCGQFYHFKGRMSLTMVEIGRTFKKNVTEFDKKFSNFNSVQCIEWAVKSGNTTKNKEEAGGLGLDLIREFLTLNNGKLQICSDDGYWEEKKNTKFAQKINDIFTGSIVNIEFNLNDQNSYFSKEEFKIEDIL